MLYTALLEADIEKANMLTNALLAFLEQHEESKYLSASIYYDLVNTFYKARTKLETDEELLELDISIMNFKGLHPGKDDIARLRELFQAYVDSIENAQKKVEGYHYSIRKNVVEYDNVLNRQREKAQ